MSKWPMRGHFRYLRFKTFLMTLRTPQCEVFWALLSSSKHSRVPEDSKFPFWECWTSPPHLAQSRVGTSLATISQCYQEGGCIITYLFGTFNHPKTLGMNILLQSGKFQYVRLGFVTSRDTMFNQARSAQVGAARGRGIGCVRIWGWCTRGVIVGRIDLGVREILLPKGVCQTMQVLGVPHVLVGMSQWLGIQYTTNQLASKTRSIQRSL